MRPRWAVDASNVIGSTPNGWWRDRAVAVRRLVADRDHFAEQTGDRVTVMLDAGEPPPAEDAEGARSLRRQLGAS